MSTESQAHVANVKRFESGCKKSITIPPEMTVRDVLALIRNTRYPACCGGRLQGRSIVTNRDLRSKPIRINHYKYYDAEGASGNGKRGTSREEAMALLHKYGWSELVVNSDFELRGL